LIAQKFPEMHGSPNVYHASLCIADLMGHPVPMTGQILLAGGRLVKVGCRTGVVYEELPEAEAFSRWQKHEFLEIERLYASVWRKTITSLDLKELAKTFRAIGISGKSVKTLEEAKTIAESVVNSQDNIIERMKLLLLFLNIPRILRRQILQLWINAGYPPLVNYAPYAAYVLTVEVFFQVALAADLISSERPSNRVDIAYLFYLPFCMVFVSSDRLHRRCALPFLRGNQEFVWGNDLKKDLERLNKHYAQLPEIIKSRGVISFASAPPKEGGFLVTSLWDRHLPRWRESREKPPLKDPLRDSKIVEEIKKLTKAPPLQPEDVDFDPRNVDSLSIQRLVRKRKGTWWQLPKDLEVSEDN